jgi:molecular chaperone HtpG
MLAEHEYREDLGKLLRYESSATAPGKTTSLAEYVTRMPGDQTEVYYLLAASREAAESSPYFEVFKARGQEVLFVHDAIDEFVLDRLMEFEKKPVVAAEKASLKVATPAGGGLSPEAAQGLAQWLKETLGDRVGEVRVSERLVDSPAVVLEQDTHLTSSMRRVLKSLQREEVGGGKLDLEINPRHALVVGLEPLREGKPALAVKFAEQLLDSARMAAGLLEDPRVMLHRINELMTELMPQGQAVQAGAQPTVENRD